MKTLIKLLAIVMLVLLIGCSSISYNTDYDPSVDFASYKTYHWYKGDPVEGDALLQYPLVQRRLQNSTDKSLAAKGFTKVETGDADFVVILHAGLKEKTQLNTTSTGGYGYGRYGAGWGGMGGMSTTDVVTYDEATLVVDIADSGKKELVWRGTATGVVGNAPSDQEEAQANADEIISTILAKFPPTATK